MIVRELIAQILDVAKDDMDKEVKVGRVEGEIVGYRAGYLVVRDVLNIMPSRIHTSRQEKRGEEGLLQREYIIIECI